MTRFFKKQFLPKISKSGSFIQSRFSRINLAVFFLVFGGIGSYFVFFSHAASITGDINGDGTVDGTDLSYIVSSFNQNTSTCIGAGQFTCDLNGDGTVDYLDLSVLVSFWGQSSNSGGPVNTAEPIASGTVAAGQIVSTTNGSWTNFPSSYSYQWQRCPTDGTACTDISGATLSTYTVGAGDSGDVLRAKVTAMNAAGSSAAVPSPMIPFGDNFANDTSIDTNVWDSFNHHGDATQPEPECYVPENLTIANDSTLGANVMQQLTQHRTVNPCNFGPGQASGSASYASAETQSSTFNWEYGTLKAKIEFSGGDTWPALWMDGSAVGQYPTNLDSAVNCNIAKEIDIAEINHYTQLNNPSVVSEYDNANADCSFPTDCQPTVSNLSTAYHIFEFDWSSTQMVFKIDGATKCTIGSGGLAHPILNVPSFPMIDTAMNTSFGTINNATLPASTKVAWIYITTNSPSATSTPTLTDTTSAGRFLHGDTVSVANNIWGSGMTCGANGVNCSYLWKRCNPSSNPSNGAECTVISGATSQTYTLAAGDAGDYITASVTATTTSGGASASTPLSIAVN